MSEFSDITLLECNRRQSTQAQTDNTSNALYTNRMGDVIHLDAGDTIELKSAFINQRGCGDTNSIEFKGEFLGVQGKFTETTETNLYYYDDITSNLNQNPANPYDPNNNPTTAGAHIQGSLAHRYIENKTVKKDLKDNEANIEINFYKNSNGEGYIMLPRVFPAQDFDTDHDVGNKFPQDMWCQTNRIKDTTGTRLAPVYKRGFNSGIAYYEPELNNNHWHLFNTNDYHIVTERNSPTNVLDHYTVKRQKNDNSRFTLFERDYDWMTPGTYTKYDFVPPKNDPPDPNITITASKWYDNSNDGGNWIGTGTDSFPLKWGAFHDDQRDPALATYKRRTDLINIEVEKGFNSPESIANQITQQLQAQVKDSPFIDSYIVGTIRGPASGKYTEVIKTKTFKPIYCANVTTMNSYNSNLYFSKTPLDHRSSSSFDYHTNYHNILVKRPEIFEAGRKVNSWTGNVGNLPNFYNPLDPPDNSSKGGGNYIQNDLAVDAALKNNWTDFIVTSWKWTEDNLKMLGELFEAQGLYPELFSNKEGFWELNQIWTNRYYPNFVDPGNPGDIAWMPEININNSRFLHMNTMNLHGNVDRLDQQKNFLTLGSDGYQQFTYDNGLVGGDKRTYDTSHMSAPVFFKYMPENKRKMTSGTSTNDLAYGFATKSQPKFYNVGTDETYYITIHPELANGIRPELFQTRGGYKATVVEPEQPAWQTEPVMAGSTLIGWDYHFNSFGNVVMLPFTGMLKQNFDGSTLPGINTVSGYESPVETVTQFKQTYIGSNNCACAYDAISGKFGWEYLHVPENVGNLWNSGQSNTIDKKVGDIENFPIIEDAANECYKINKRLEMWSFCPDMVPYVQNAATINGYIMSSTPKPSDASKTDPVQLDPLNHNLEPWVIYDSHMGINLNLGKAFNIDVTKDAFSEDEIWNSGLLGILGFSRAQFNPKIINNTNNGEARVRYDNIRSLYNITTNAQPTGADTKQFMMNPFGAVQYTTQIPYGLVLHMTMPTTPYYDGQPPTDIPKWPIQVGNRSVGTPIVQSYSNWGYMPAIVIDTTSIKVEGVSLPRVIIRPYLTIRSDVLAKSRYIGGKNSGLSLPIISVVNRINASKDFIQLEGSETHTITAPISFSSITTAICDPDGTLSELDDASAVIYKITKVNSLSNYDVLNQIKQTLKKTKK